MEVELDGVLGDGGRRGRRGRRSILELQGFELRVDVFDGDRLGLFFLSVFELIFGFFFGFFLLVVVV